MIPGTAGITPGPGVDLSNWNTAPHNLRYADFSGGLDLSGANFSNSWLDNAHFQGANLTGASLYQSTLTNADLGVANLSNAYLDDSTLTNADLSVANLSNAYLFGSTLTNADLGGATVTGANFGGTTSRGFTKEQLYSTASYQAKNLQGIGLV